MRYVIIAPTYNQKSAGIRVLQELQKWLIRFGKDAIIPNININSPYQIEDDDIVVYPEIIRGNPLKAKRVVRYILNAPGKLGGDKQYDKDEILVTYDGVLCQLENNIHLQIPCVEEFFADRGCQRIVDCYWIGKGKNTRHPIVKDAIEITYTWPEKRRALAELLNRTKTFYTYDDRTALTLEAMLCGCEVKQIKNEEIIDVRPVGPLIDLENFKAQLNQFIKMTWYPEMDSGREAAEYIDSIISHRSPGLAPSSRIPGLTSIIILTWNQLDYTKACLASLRAHTEAPYEIIFVDNGSSDGTVEWLRERAGQYPSYRLIENSSNLGFSKGCNQGIKAACGDRILLLNNDVVVTEGWLSGMMECLQSAPDIGIVGPMTNNISGPQKVPGVGYSSIDELAEYARAFRQKNRHRRIPRRRVVGFCMLFQRHLIEKVGLLDESFGSGNFEDDDFCIRASLEGYRNLIAGDVFVHHYGSRTFIGNRVDYGSSLTGNRKVFAEKWSRKDIAQRFGKKLLIENAIASADELDRKGDIAKATAALLEAIKIAPEDRGLYLKLAEMLIDGKRYDDALGILESVPRGDNDKRQLALLGCCEEGLGHDDKAKEYAARALAIDPSMALALNIAGVVACKKGEKDAAEGLFKKAIDSDPGFGESYTNLGSLRWAAGEPLEALTLFERGFILSPSVADVAAAYHSAVVETGSFERAEPVFRDARALHPNDKRIVFIIIAMLIQQGKHDLAMREIEHAMIQFGIGDGILNAALEIRLKTGPLEIRPGSARRSLSICMIVKNEELSLARCLMSVKPVADEIIVVDTGSTDRTRAIAAALGAKVFDLPWTNDFSEARNYSLSKASGEWILVLDADEIISALDHDKLKKLVRKAKKRVAYSMVTRNYTNQAGARGWTANEGRYIQEEAGRGWFPSPKVRLFANDKRIKFINPVHELVEPALEKLGIKIQTCDIPIQHYGRLNQDKLIAKGKEYYRLGIAKIEKAQGDYNALKELGIQAAEIGEYEEAVHIWQKVLDVKPQDPVAFMNMGYAHLMLEQYEKAKAFSKNALDLDPELREAALNYSASELIAGDVKTAISTLETVLKKHPDYPPAFGRMAAACLVGGRKNDGVGYLDRLHARGFNCASVLEEQARALHAQGKNAQAVILLEVALEKGMTNGRIHPLLAECRQKMKYSSCVTQ